MTEFSALALIDPLQRGLKEVGYGQMTPVQAASLPAILAGRDVVAQARTGSGKTAAGAKLVEDRLGEPLRWESPTWARSQAMRRFQPRLSESSTCFPRAPTLLSRDWHEKALQGLRASKIKGRTIRVRRIGS